MREGGSMRPVAPEPGRSLGRQEDVPVRRIELFISSGCNLHCSFCCESERIQRRAWMPEDQIVGWLDRAVASGVQLIQFMGGEPTLHPGFPRALREAKARGLSTFVITNLMRWEDDAFAEEVAPWLDGVMVSMHAGNAETGAIITGRPRWYARFLRARDNAARTLRGRVQAATVLTRASASELGEIWAQLRPLRPQLWVMGNAVPVGAARADALDDAAPTGALRLEELVALRPEFVRMRDACAADGCQMVFFCFPHCVLGPELWGATHDFVLDSQDLSADAPADKEGVNFWSEAEYHQEPRPVTLARRRTERCAGCAREAVCGGHFSEHLRRYGDGAMAPIPKG